MIFIKNKFDTLLLLLLVLRPQDGYVRREMFTVFVVMDTQVMNSRMF